MRILTYSDAAWDDRNSFGNTISNWFYGACWNEDAFSNIYCRSQLPDNKLQVNYYCLTSIGIIKGILKGKIQGKNFSSNDVNTLRKNQCEEAQTEKARIDRIHNAKTHWVYFANDLLWMSRIWLNKYFKKFIEKENPEIFFAFAYGPSSLWPIVSYLKKHTDCKVVLFVADDVKGSYNKRSWLRKRYLNRQLRHCIESADRLYAVSEEMSVLYNDYYGKEVSTLYKGCDLSPAPRVEPNKPLRIVYAGNLLWERDNTLSIIAKALEKYNESGIKATLEIYSSATITPELEQKLNITGSSKLMGSRPYDEIKQIMHDADIVLHVESFNPDYMDTVKYSFSTKIIDCLQSGSQVLGIGPKGLASIEYLRKVDGALVIDDEQSIESKITKLLDNSESIKDNIRKTRNFAVEHHEIGAVQKKLRQEFETLCHSVDKH